MQGSLRTPSGSSARSRNLRGGGNEEDATREHILTREHTLGLQDQDIHFDVRSARDALRSLHTMYV